MFFRFQELDPRNLKPGGPKLHTFFNGLLVSFSLKKRIFFARRNRKVLTNLLDI